MNYPVWELYFAGGGLPIAIIAVVHVYVAHFAVGGGLFLVLTEIKGIREKSPDILEYTRRHAKFFMLLTMVFGGVTGVGIWFTISLLSPGATSTLIHLFLFVWAAEWVFFTLEIIALFLYYYKFNKIDDKSHLKIGWIYFISAWLSLFLINGIITFMLTPGQWIETMSFWDGFFNPSMVPSLFFRTALAFLLAGLFGFITSSFIKDDIVRLTMERYCAKWVLIPFFFMLLFAWLYLHFLPAQQKGMILHFSPEIEFWKSVFVWVLPMIFAGTLFMAFKVPGKIKKVMAFSLLAIGLVYMGAFEWIRESARRPYLIYGHTYSSSILVSKEDEINKKGILNIAKWVTNRDATGKNAIGAGREIFRIQCISCHSVGGPLNDILPITEKFTILGMDAQLNVMGKIGEYMPKFMGTSDERMALARFIVTGLHNKIEEKISYELTDKNVKDFEKAGKKDYLLLAASDKGILTISDGEPHFSLQPPGSGLYAQLILKGESPEIITENTIIYYSVEKGFETPSRHVKFWDQTENYYGNKLPVDTGLTGNGMKGVMKYDQEYSTFVAKGIPLVPYTNDGSFNPYPIVTLEARSKDTREVLARTWVTAPVSTEMGCKNCHGGKWRVNDMAGLTEDTTMDIITVHDRINRTNLKEKAKLGRSTLCGSCHWTPGSKVKGKKELLSLSSAIHGFHANALTNKGAEACHSCHPSSSTGATRFFRGIHKDIGLDCTSCHGTLEDHALSLLLAERKAGKKNSEKLMKWLSPQRAKDDIQPRIPYVNMPDCLNCHEDFQPPETDEHPLNAWTKSANERFSIRVDDTGIKCISCHGSVHALYPATNPYGPSRDNIQPKMFQDNRLPMGANKNCKVCHTVDMEEPIHHPNIISMFRNL